MKRGDRAAAGGQGRAAGGARGDRAQPSRSSWARAHLLGPGGPRLRTAIEQGRAHSMVLYGPPRLGQDHAGAESSPSARARAFEELSAVAAGRAEVREVIERASHRRAIGGEGGTRTILFPG